MGVLAAGSVVVVPFPFSDLSDAKRRPAVVLADAGRGDWILCMVTSNAYADPNVITIGPGNFRRGALRQVSYVRPGKLFTAHESLVSDVVGELHGEVVDRLRDAVVQLVRP